MRHLVVKLKLLRDHVLQGCFYVECRGSKILNSTKDMTTKQLDQVNSVHVKLQTLLENHRKCVELRGFAVELVEIPRK